ncbi:hypothetical protein GHT06_011951 [Daphnia sinensis]|uniref:Uncharacterized protein n=1 Tax=Daphnia sinensis TaxID=1820382 RepID=A0AAD5LE12_9CRUS|nr:hypothetical protein GHT06_011951 [Daphnia sinensis]
MRSCWQLFRDGHPKNSTTRLGTMDAYVSSSPLPTLSFPDTSRCKFLGNVYTFFLLASAYPHGAQESHGSGDAHRREGFEGRDDLPAPRCVFLLIAQRSRKRCAHASLKGQQQLV